MAAPQCMSQDGRTAVFVGTMLETGDGFTLCDECLAAWCAALLSAMTGIDPTPFIAAISEDQPIPFEVADQAAGDGTVSSDIVAGDAGEGEGEGDAAEWVKSGSPPPGSRTASSGGRSRHGRSSAAAPTGRGGDDE
jgi:hypothetical protein